MSSDSQRGEGPRALVVHEWFASIGGSENVANALRQHFEGSDLLCLWRDEHVSIPGAGKVTQTLLSARPFRGRKILCLPLMPLIWRWTSARTHGAEVVIVSSHLFAHHVAVPRGTPKLVYVHTPARYIWEPDFDNRGQNPLIRIASSLLKPLDRWRASEATELAANSEFVRARIKRTWGRDSRVIYPPVDVDEIRATADWSLGLSHAEKAALNELPIDFVLGASRFIPYKRLDLAIRAGELSGMPVVVAGAGPEEARLRALAAQNTVPVHFVISPSNRLLRALYQRAALYIFPPVEDFGIMPVESIAAGTPVVANGHGGASESVVEGLTGSHFVPDDDESLLHAIGRSLSLDRTKISGQASRFSRQRFDDEVARWVEDHVTRESTFHE
ncbi:glycosyl transferase, group 1 [Arthrobacter sp. FB24]|uniref:glycosyltransferase n=1 Tax=Arthrobacter sp. (strain FB24) TaxID=290399 RepID=UPI00005274B8|nr:glycosyltransferase [Arthrobacter sp. FB24]ABK04581.1 glycosyl transferase, group 1 [Arthrobacter sp. FB24]